MYLLTLAAHVVGLRESNSFFPEGLKVASVRIYRGRNFSAVRLSTSIGSLLISKILCSYRKFDTTSFEIEIKTVVRLN